MGDTAIQTVDKRKQVRLKKIIARTAIVFVLILAATVATAWYLIQRAAPQVEGELTLPGLSAEVNIYRDTNGVPHIEAENEHDLFMAQGYITAQDRLFQMDLARRQASGRLSEIVGDATIEQDKFFLTLGLRRAAEASIASYSARSKEILDWYAAGVNSFMEEAKENNQLPIEFSLLGYEPEEWSSVDSLTIGKYMAFDLGGHWEGQAFRQYLLQHFSEEEAMELFPSYPKDGPTVIQEAKNATIDFENSFRAAVVPNTFNGSNNWVVSGDRTDSGKPLLANDPHLGLSTPSIWYESHLVSPTFNVSGVIFAGIPGIIVGRNDDIAWGVTNVGPDVQDLYIEKRNPEDPYEFKYKDKWEKAEVIKEEIKVKDGESVPYEVVVTRHGPILSEFALNENPDTALALKWTALQPSTELEAVLRFARSKDWEDFKDALTYFHTPAQNFVFASQDGTIAYRANGLIPIRKKGDSMLPVPGWTDEYEWDGFIPWDELPTIVNPEEGFISTANNKIVREDYPYHITHTWAQPYRQKRIRDVLSQEKEFTAGDMQQLQFDQKNLQAEEFVPLFLEELKKKQDELSDFEKSGIALLEKWDYKDDKDAAAPLLFNLWMTSIDEVLFADDISEEMLELFDGRRQVVDQLLRKADSGEGSKWIDKKGGLTEVITRAYELAYNRASDLQGKDPTDWKWGEFHKAAFHHPLSAVKPLHLLFDPDLVPMGGSSVTVAAASWDWETGEADHGGAWRSVIDLSEMDNSFNVVGPGQSGFVFSDWYDDQLQDWTTGGYHVTTTDMALYRKTSDKLVLKPEE